jgi:hypothetical protein
MPIKGWRGFEKDVELAAIKAALTGVDTKAKGDIAESYIAARLTELGFEVWHPYMNNHKSDLAVCQNGQLIRLQAKSAGFDLQSERFRVMLTTRDKTGKHIKYNPDDVDFFIVKCEGVWAFYVIPAGVGIEHHSVNFYPHRDRVWTRSFDCEGYRDAFDLIKAFDRGKPV